MEVGSDTKGGRSTAVMLDAAILAWTMEVFPRTRSQIPVWQHKLLILLLSLPPPPARYIKSDSKDTILLCKTVCILTSSRKGYFQFTLLNQLLSFYSNISTSSSDFQENTIRFTTWKLPVHLDGNWGASVNFVPCEKPVRHGHLHLCRWIPKNIRIKRLKCHLNLHK